MGSSPTAGLIEDGISGSNPTLDAASDGGDDFVGTGGPGEEHGLGVVLFEEAVDGAQEIDNLIWNRPCTKA
jgi:hypothetical protein